MLPFFSLLLLLLLLLLWLLLLLSSLLFPAGERFRFSLSPAPELAANGQSSTKEASVEERVPIKGLFGHCRCIQISIFFVLGCLASLT